MTGGDAGSVKEVDAAPISRRRRVIATSAGLLVVLALLAFWFVLRADPPVILVSSPETRAQPWYPVEVLDISDIEDDVIIERDLQVAMSDGVQLSATVFRPDAPGEYPVVMAFTAYGKDGGPDRYPTVLEQAVAPDIDLGTFAVSPWTTWEGPDPAFWVPEGYAVVYVDSRGYGDSEGSASILSIQDRDDFGDAIEWAGTQAWSNGNVGLTGVSYLAIAQWVAASGNPPHLKAIIPWEGQSDNFREVLYHGGIPETAFTSYWLNRMRALAHDSPLPPPFIFEIAHGRPQLMQLVQERLQDPSGIDLPSIRVPALICATWSDQGLHSRGSFEAYKQIASEQKWLFTHGRSKWATYYGEEALEVQKGFFDYFLKEVDNGFSERSPVRLEVRESLEEYAVRYEDSWPIERTGYQKLFLDASEGTLTATPPSGESAARYDPADGNAEFTMRFDEDTELSGHMKLRLWVSTEEGSDLDLFVGIEKRDHRGSPVRFYAKTGYVEGPVAMGWLRVSQRELDEELSTPWQPVLAHERSLPVSPGEIVSVEIEILPSSTLFREGESLVVIVQGRDLFDHPVLAHERSANEGTHVLHTGGGYDAHLLVPVIPLEP